MLNKSITSPKSTQPNDNINLNDSSKHHFGSKALIITAKNEISKKNYDTALSILKGINNEASLQEVIFLQAVCYMHMKDYQQALKLFKSYNIPQNPSTLMSICKCYCALQDYEKALEYLNSCIKINSHYIQAYFLRGKLLIELRRYDEAINDLVKQKHPSAFLLLAKCWKNKRHYDNAVKYLEKYKTTANYHEKYLFELGKVQYCFKKTVEALQVFEILYRKDRGNYEVGYYKSKCLMWEKIYEEAELLLEKIAQSCENEELANRALFRIALIKMEKFDFFASFFAIRRVKGVVKSGKKQFYQKFIEAAYYVVQNNFSTAIEYLTTLINDNIYPQGLSKCLIFRGFSYFSIKDFDKTIFDYQQAESISPLDPASLFNYKISLAITNIFNKDYPSAYKILGSEFFKRFSNPMWPMLKIHTKIFMMSKNITHILDLQNDIRGLKLEKNCEFYLLGAFFLYLKTDIELAFKKINKSLKMSDKSSFLSYTIRAFCFINFKMYSEAAEDLTSALCLNEDLKTLRAYRSLCYYYCDNEKDAMDDIFCIFDVGDYNAMLLSVYMLVVCQKYEKALEIVEHVEKTDEILLLKAHCYLLLENYDESISTLCQRCNNTDHDIFMIQSLKSHTFLSQGPGILINHIFSHWYEAVSNFLNLQYDTAINIFEIVLENINDTQDELIFADNSVFESIRLEILYNLAICYIFSSTQSNLTKASELIEVILELSQSNQHPFIYILLAITEKGLKNTNKLQKTLEKLIEISSEMYTNFISHREMRLNPVFYENKFMENMEYFCIPGFENLFVRPIVRLPMLPPPLEISDSYEALINLLRIEGPIIRPEVPWLAKVNDKYMFTDEMIDDISSFKSESAVNLKNEA
ncbi:hypothetical protein SteCoe_7614 [Stentor coeruleus]|uniref:Uncharacterized protein n=1 Tax=Stentor coeruleus TaxID=5963 RepID=A0A1R2CM76_9CILI|nr:hypothetical protein SteCoe_7614 [Stentor coeruleus]